METQRRGSNGRRIFTAQFKQEQIARVARLREAIDAGATFAYTVPGTVIINNSGIAPDPPWLAPLRGYPAFEELVRPDR